MGSRVAAASSAPHRVASTVASLARQLGVPQRELTAIASSVGRHYVGWDVRAPARNARKPPKWRHFDLPQPPLKLLQQRIRKRILLHCDLPSEIFGYRRGATTAKHAAQHVGQAQILSLDLKDCFPRISNNAVYRALVRELDCTPDVASLLTKLTTLHQRLPQGTPTSPDLANIVLVAMYRELTVRAERLGLVATYWADDITISGDNVRPHIDGFISTIVKHGHAVRNKKVFITPRGKRQVVTGLQVNNRVTVSRAYFEGVRSTIIRAGHQPSISETDLQSLNGKIRHVCASNPKLGDVLRALADLRLPEGDGRRVSRRSTWQCCNGKACQAG